MGQKQKGFVPIVILAAVVVLAAAGGAVYYVRKAKEPTLPVAENQVGDWQEYLNEKYFYKIKYPPDWFFHKTGYNPPPPAAIELSNVDEKAGYVGNEISLQIISLEAVETLEDDAEIKSLESQGFSRKDLVFAGEPAVRLEKENREGGVDTSLYVIHKGNLYRFGWELWNSEILRLYKGTLEKILGTFVFTN